MRTQSILLLTQEELTLAQLHNFFTADALVSLDIDGKDRVQRARLVIDSILDGDRPVYGVNTGLGKLADIRIPRDHANELQRRLILSHAAGIGTPMPIDIVRLMIILKLKALGQGYSGCRWELLELLTNMLNSGVIPVVPIKGSVGASGDMAPLAHMALTMIGEGKTWRQTAHGWQMVSAQTALAEAGLEPIMLEAKEGLAIINGTQAMTAYLVWTLLKARYLLKTADIVGAISLEALLGTLTAYDQRIHALRPHPGQRAVASNIRRILSESPMVASHRDTDHKVQDAYSLRCIPQVHGAVRDALTYINGVVEREINAVTDNPLVFSATGDVLSGGNFHGAPIAMAADYLAIVLTDLASIAERRIAHLLDTEMSALPRFLTPDSGLNSGFMIAQVTAAALVSENKVLSHPASVDSIPTSANQEDHVSMGTHAARKAWEIFRNLEYVLAIELLSSVQALDLRSPLTPSAATKAVHDLVRKRIPFWEEDRLMHRDIDTARSLIRQGQVVEAAESICGPLD